jgi:diguanylate cyclase (GGDEF)-like protein
MIGPVRAAASLLVLLSALVISEGAAAKNGPCPINVVIDGSAELACWDGASPIALTGGWYLDYEADSEDLTWSGLTHVPSVWQDMSPELPATGRGVYRLSLNVASPLEQLGLKLPDSNMARKVVLIDADGVEKVIYDSGNTGLADLSIAPMRMPVIAVPRIESGSTIVVTIRNSFSAHGGIEVPIIIGPMEELVRHEQALIIFAAIITAILFVFFVVNGGLWLAGDKDSVLIILSIVALLSSFRQAVVSGFLFDIFPNITNLFESGAGWYSFFGVAIAGSSYFRANYPQLLPRWVVASIVALTVVGVLLHMFQPLLVVQAFAMWYRPILAILMVILLGFLWSGAKGATRELKYTLAGSSFAVVSMVVEILIYQNTQYEMLISISSLGFLTFIATETVMMTQRYSHSILRSENLAAELRLLNSSLEGKIEERTVELASVNERLINMAHTDSLTGLANRRAFDEALRKEEARSNRSGRNLIIGIVDLDNFKEINDQFGHRTGDDVLKGIARILIESVRATDVTCRWGGDEFSVLFPETSREAAFLVTDRLRQAISQEEFVADSGLASVTASIGLAEYVPGLDVEDVIDAADMALYQSKKYGRDQVAVAWEEAEAL